MTHLLAPMVTRGVTLNGIGVNCHWMMVKLDSKATGPAALSLPVAYYWDECDLRSIHRTGPEEDHPFTTYMQAKPAWKIETVYGRPQ